MEENVKQENPDVNQLQQNFIQVSQENINLRNRLQAAINQLQSIEVGSMQLNVLFKVLKYSEHFPAEFVEQCAEQIKSALTPPTQTAE